MLKFAEPIYLYLLLLVPALITLHILFDIKKRRDFKNFGNSDLLKALMPNVSIFRPKIKFFIQIFALILIVIVLAQPQFGERSKKMKKSGLKIMIALDVSKSMLCEDVKPSRMEIAKQLAEQIIEYTEEYKIGLVVFAGSPFVQLPITNDYVSAKMFLATINPDIIESQGTAIASAIDLCVRSFGEKKGMESQAIILITDAENHEDDEVKAAKFAADEGIQISVIGVGTLKGAPIPLSKKNSFLKDKDGNVVITKLDEKKARDIAIAGNGIYVRADNTNHALSVLKKELRNLLKTEYEETVFTDQNEQFQSFAFFALFFLLIDLCILSRKNKRLSKMKFFDIKKNQ